MRSAPLSPTEEFAAWRRSERLRQIGLWTLGAALLAPGVIGYLLSFPRPACAALEVAGLLGNVWVRRERRRNLREIARWEGDRVDY